jgi:DNA-binding NtrC family response regulator
MKSLHLLYLEDETAHSGLLERVLAGTEWEVKSCRSLASATPLLDEGWPDLLLMDLRLGNAPPEAGFNTLQQLKRAYPDLLIVVTSVSDFSHAIPYVQGLGAATFIRKPINIETIHSELLHLVETNN